MIDRHEPLKGLSRADRPSVSVIRLLNSKLTHHYVKPVTRAGGRLGRRAVCAENRRDLDARGTFVLTTTIKIIWWHYVYQKIKIHNARGAGIPRPEELDTSPVRGSPRLFVDKLPSKDAALRFGYTPGSFRIMCHAFRQDLDREFFTPPIHRRR